MVFTLVSCPEVDGMGPDHGKVVNRLHNVLVQMHCIKHILNFILLYLRVLRSLYVVCIRRAANSKISPVRSPQIPRKAIAPISVAYRLLFSKFLSETVRNFLFHSVKPETPPLLLSVFLDKTPRFPNPKPAEADKADKLCPLIRPDSGDSKLT
jgi:hypothetical protein